MAEKEEIQLTVPTGDVPLWLLERRKLPKDWGKKLKLVQSKYESLLRDINAKPSLSEVQSFVNPRKDRMQLKDWEETERLLISSSEGKEKTIFGRYSSPLIKDTRLIIAMLKKDNLYLADIGKEITARLQFEIPGLRKQMAAFDKQAKDALNKASEYDRSSVEAMRRFRAECQNLGIAGNSLDAEILNLVGEVPLLFGKGLSKLRTTKIATFIEFYEEYCKDLCGDQDPTPKRLQYLAYVQKYGDTIAELVKNRLEGLADSPTLLKRDKEKYEVYSNFAQVCQDSIAKDFVIVDSTGNGDKKGARETEEVTQEETLLSDHKQRDLLLNDVAESEAFAMRKLQELKGSDQAIFMTYGQSDRPKILQENDNPEFLESVLGDLQEAYKILTAKRLYMLLEIKHKPDSKDRIKANLERHIALGERNRREKKWHEDKNKEVLEEIRQCREKLQRELKIVEELKEDAQKGIAEIFKCRIFMA